MLELNEILDNSTVCEKKSIIYFLIKDNEIVYVGQSKLGVRRVYEHISTKDFDRYYFIECEEKNLNNFEALYVAKFNPKYNTTFPTNNYFKSFTQLKEMFSVGSIELKKIIRRHKIKSFFDGNHYLCGDIEKAFIEEGVSYER